MDKNQLNPIYTTYDINFRDICTKNGIRYILTGISPKTMKTFWVYNRLDQKFVSILNEWIKK